MGPDLIRCDGCSRTGRNWLRGDISGPTSSSSESVGTSVLDSASETWRRRWPRDGSTLITSPSALGSAIGARTEPPLPTGIAPDQRTAAGVELRCFGGLNETEIAEALGISLATLHRDWKVARVYPDGTPSLFKTTYGGATWSAINSGLAGIIGTRTPIKALVLDPKLSVLYLGPSRGGVFKSI